MVEPSEQTQSPTAVHPHTTYILGQFCNPISLSPPLLLSVCVCVCECVCDCVWVSVCVTVFGCGVPDIPWKTQPPTVPSPNPAVPKTPPHHITPQTTHQNTTLSMTTTKHHHSPTIPDPGWSLPGVDALWVCSVVSGGNLGTVWAITSWYFIRVLQCCPLCADHVAVNPT